MKTVYKVLHGMMVLSLLVFVITSCKKDDKSVVVENVDENEDYVDLGLSSGTLWKNFNEGNFYTYNDAISTFGDQLPSDEQFYELIDECTWDWEDNGYNITGPNGNSIVLPAAGGASGRFFLVAKGDIGTEGHYCFLTQERQVGCMTFSKNNISISSKKFRELNIKMILLK